MRLWREVVEDEEFVKVIESCEDIGEEESIKLSSCCLFPVRSTSM